MGAVGIGCRENKGAAKHLTILRTAQITTNFPGPMSALLCSRNPGISQDLGLTCPNNYPKLSPWPRHSMQGWSETTDRNAFA